MMMVAEVASAGAWSRELENRRYQIFTNCRGNARAGTRRQPP
jgi:hypothetical protein